VLTPNKGGKTSAMILEKQLLLPINLGSVIRAFPNYLELFVPNRLEIFPIFPGVDVPASSPQGQNPKSSTG